VRWLVACARLTRTNAALAALTGRSSWELLGAQVTEVFAGLAPDTPSLCRRVMDTRTLIVGMFASVGGRALRIDYHPLPAANGGSSEGLWIVVSDATVHHALDASEARYQSVVAAMAEGVILVDAEARITACNASAERILGRDHDEIIGRALGDSLCAAVRADGTPEPADELPAVDTLRTGRAHHDVVRGVRLDVAEVDLVGAVLLGMRVGLAGGRTARDVGDATARDGRDRDAADGDPAPAGPAGRGSLPGSRVRDHARVG